MERNEKAGTRADAWLRARYPQLTRRQIEEALEQGYCVYRGRSLRKGDRIEDVAAMNCEKLEAHLRAIRQGNPALQIPLIREADRYFIVDKPAGVKSHPLSLFDTDTVTHWAFARDSAMALRFEEALPTVVPHRLDTGTSGCLIVARDAKTYVEWRERFAAKQIEKTYEAWCWGSPDTDELSVEGQMAHHSADRRKMILLSEGEAAEGPLLPSRSRVRVIERRAPDLFRARISCQTGVTHQVRVHLASRGFPLVGDRLYDKQFPSRRWRPVHHQLRASSLQWENDRIEAPMAEFAAAGGES